MKVIKLTKTYFELEDGSIYEHPTPLTDVPTIQEFQKIYDKWSNLLLQENKEKKDND